MWTCGLFVVMLAVPFVAPQCLTANDQITANRRPSPSVLSALRTGQVDFSIDLFKELEKLESKQRPGKEGNLFYSPESVHQALLMAFYGAEGDTERQLRKLLHLGDISKVDVMMAYKFSLLLSQMRGTNQSYELAIANRLYFEQSQEIRTCTQDFFKEELQFVDFINSAEDVRLDINKWVETTTRGKIQDLIPPGVLGQETLLALVNSAYFKGQWLTRFEPEHTRLETFFISDTELAQVEMMNVTGNFRYYPSEELQAHVFELPYEGEHVSMLVLLPPFLHGGKGEHEVMRRLSGKTIGNAIKTIQDVEMDRITVLLPKFRLEQEFELSQSLSDLGAPSMFDSASANFGGFSSTPGISFSAAIHKAFVEVNEEGTEAAAATALLLSRIARTESSTLYCNHPFVFMIYSRITNSILFLGMYRNPKA